MNQNFKKWFDATIEGISPEDSTAIEETVKTVASLIVGNWQEIKRILEKNNEVAISQSISLKNIGKRVNGKVKMAWAEKFADEGEFLTNDPDQPDLQPFGGGQ